MFLKAGLSFVSSQLTTGVYIKAGWEDPCITFGHMVFIWEVVTIFFYCSKYQVLSVKPFVSVSKCSFLCSKTTNLLSNKGLTSFQKTALPTMSSSWIPSLPQLSWLLDRSCLVSHPKLLDMPDLHSSLIFVYFSLESPSPVLCLVSAYVSVRSSSVKYPWHTEG